jgi:apolipoprotein D and lipocalin family protein
VVAQQALDRSPVYNVLVSVGEKNSALTRATIVPTFVPESSGAHMYSEFLGSLIVGTMVAGLAAPDMKSTLSTVPHVDLNRYAGKWYEIARYPNFFQRNCEGDTTATYRLKSDGTVGVVNSCRDRKGKLKKAEGTARVADKASNAKLKVTFFWPFSGNYWVIDLGTDYEYAVVGEPSRKYLWVLSRTPAMDEDKYRQVMQKIVEAGYDPAKLIRTPQSGQ